MIEIHCPACGAEGRTTKEKINTRLVCRKCFVAFHITPSGRALLGDPPLMGGESRETAGTAEPDRTQEVDQWFERLSGALFSPRTAMLVAGLIVLISVRQCTRGARPSRIVSRRSPARLTTATPRPRIPGGGRNCEDVIKWNDAIQYQLDQVRKSLGNMPPSINVEVRRQDTSKGMRRSWLG